MSPPSWLLPPTDPRRVAAEDQQRRQIAQLEALAKANGDQIRLKRGER